jgi:murein DD-endopeptidase MepM/ murein hydrolase activator NlpD
MSRTAIGSITTGVIALALMASAAQAFPKPKYAIRMEDVAPAPQASMSASASAVAAAPMTARSEPAIVASAPEPRLVMAAPKVAPVSQSSLLAPAAARPEPAAPDPVYPEARDDRALAANADALFASTADATKHPAARKADQKKGPEAKGGRPVSYTVHGGDTLSGVGRRFGVSAKAIASLNGLDTRGGVRAGQSLKLPPEAKDAGEEAHARGVAVLAAPTKLAAKPSARSAGEPVPSHRLTIAQSAASPQVAPRKSTTTQPAPRPRADTMRPPASRDGPFAPVTAPPGAPITGAPLPPQANPVQIKESNSGAMRATSGGFPDDNRIASLGRGRFMWPVRGDVVSRFGAVGPGLRNDGLNIGGRAGDGVRAAAGGEVVYAGNSLPDFGNLVLIKHADGWVTAYGHLSKIEVKMRQTVSQGQEIGQVGQTGGVDRPQLHFEVRYSPSPREKARPIDPSLILP